MCSLMREIKLDQNRLDGSCVAGDAHRPVWDFNLEFILEKMRNWNTDGIHTSIQAQINLNTKHVEL